MLNITVRTLTHLIVIILGSIIGLSIGSALISRYKNCDYVQDEYRTATVVDSVCFPGGFATSDRCKVLLDNGRHINVNEIVIKGQKLNYLHKKGYCQEKEQLNR